MSYEFTIHYFGEVYRDGFLLLIVNFYIKIVIYKYKICIHLYFMYIILFGTKYIIKSKYFKNLFLLVKKNKNI